MRQASHHLPHLIYPNIDITTGHWPILTPVKAFRNIAANIKFIVSSSCLYSRTDVGQRASPSGGKVLLIRFGWLLTLCMHDSCALAKRSSINNGERCFSKQRSFSRWTCTDTCDHHKAEEELVLISLAVQRADYGIQNGCNLSRARVVRFKHNDLEDLERVLQSEIASHKALRWESSEEPKYPLPSYKFLLSAST